MKKIIALFACSLLSVDGPVFAATILVPTEQATIQAAIDKAAAYTS